MNVKRDFKQKDEDIKFPEPQDWKQPDEIKVKNCEHLKTKRDCITEGHNVREVEVCLNCGKVVKILSDKLVL